METIAKSKVGTRSSAYRRVPVRRPMLPSWCHWLFGPLAAAIITLCATWIQIEDQIFQYQFFWVESLWWHRAAWFVGWVFLTLVYFFFLGLTNRAPAAVVCTSIFLCVPALICYYKLQLRGEPFLPWDFAQASEAFDVAGKVNLWVTKSMCGAVVVLLLLTLVSCFLPRLRFGWVRWILRSVVPLVGAIAMVFGVFLQQHVTQDILYISPDAWMQDRYYRNYSLVTAFFTNMQVMQVDAPEGYNAEHVQQVVNGTGDSEPYFAASYAAKGDGTVKKPTVIYIQAEAFWDPSDVPGVTYDQQLTPNIQRTKSEMAYGKCYSPRFGGGTCDVECEALTGFSMEYLPSSCKPYVEYIHGPTASIASFRKTEGYDTLAIHGYYGKYWNREEAYADLGFDDFISLEDMTDPERKRPCDWEGGLVTEAETGRQIISAFENKDADTPLFLHAVTIQNHLAYTPENYPDNERVHVTSAPEGVTDYTIGCLEDFATGVRETDAMWGMLTDYFDTVDEPVILVMWGDHYNPIGNGMNIYSATGYGSEDANDPRVHQTPLLIWSNYWKEPVDLGTVAAYQITTVTDDLYGLDQPAYFDLLREELDLYRARTLGTTVEPDGTYTRDAEMTPEQQEMYEKQWVLQYDLLFGKNYQDAPAVEN